MARGWLKVEERKNGKMWVLRFMATRKTDGKRVEHKVPVGLVREFPSESSAWKEVQRQHLNVNLNPRWGKRVALSIEPLEIEQWLKAVKKEERLENPTLDKMRRVMSLVYKSGMRYGLIPREEATNPLRFVRCKTTSEYEALILTPKQAFDLLMALPEPERTMALLVAATGLRISECLGLQWADVEFSKQQIFVRRKYVARKIGEPKSKASKAPVPMHPLLAGFMQDWHQATPYSQPGDWIWPFLGRSSMATCG